ncbi:hypothetical protein GRS96_06180 [Rathayibacter sp. VKM Ac-2803]|uniref:hypothetical protein n=1 Tax=Rathayibacter sp. VKM Ac-2803 TaxID=2609256 RepID=UPI00135B85EC|nr:hypothetical protein [Rathayibacter sp. VKM Ac-2803]MWV48864.1 hypothetical protein [Rathayibacter sp. VKM Ac-2803]
MIIPKNDPRTALALALNSLAEGRAEAPDTETAEVKAQLDRTPEELYAPFRSASAR